MKRTALQRRTRLRPFNRERRARLHLEDFGPPGYREWIVSHPCVVPGCARTDIQACHAKSRGAGGKAEHLVPMCSDHHRESHQVGIRTFEAKRGLLLVEIAARLWNENDQRRER